MNVEAAVLLCIQQKLQRPHDNDLVSVAGIILYKTRLRLRCIYMIRNYVSGRIDDEVAPQMKLKVGSTHANAMKRWRASAYL